ncbi:MAG: DNA recombination/repair protein RecA, partial [Blastocatellia bacterium]|nr:DNA recombination/repair protein RecA [Blastocatellia bacterium]
NAKNSLRDNKELASKIEAEVRAALGIGKPQAQQAAAPTAAAPATAATTGNRRSGAKAVEE